VTREPLEAGEVVLRRLLHLGHFRFAEIHTEGDSPATRPRLSGQPCRDRLGAIVVEAHPINHRLLLRVPEHARFRVTGLGDRRDRPNLDMTETECGRRRPRPRVLVESGRESDRVWKHESKRLDGFRSRPTPSGPSLESVTQRSQRAEPRHRIDADLVRPLRFQSKQPRPNHVFVVFPHVARR
jgi:hypothetical protein